MHFGRWKLTELGATRASLIRKLRTSEQALNGDRHSSGKISFAIKVAS